jgi:hypothetical protein
MTRFCTGIKRYLKNNILTRNLEKTEPTVWVGERRMSPPYPLLLINNKLLIITTTTQQPTHTHTTRSHSHHTADRCGGGSCA